MIVCPEIVTRNCTRTHTPCIQNGSILFPFQAAFERLNANLREMSRGARKLRLSVSQRHGASLRRLLVKCGLSAGGCWAWLTRFKRVPTSSQMVVVDSAYRFISMPQKWLIQFL